MPKLPKTKLRQYRRRLVAILEELGAKVEHLEDAVLRADHDPSPDEPDEFGADNYHQEFQIGLIENEEEILREVYDAIDRIDEGTYGICDRCEEPIPPRRLEVLPYASRCVECQRKVEENGDSDDD